jgi:hypothetical protein
MLMKQNKNDTKIPDVHEVDDNIERQKLFQFVEEWLQWFHLLMVM